MDHPSREQMKMVSEKYIHLMFQHIRELYKATDQSFEP
jgi:hypothetical protein